MERVQSRDYPKIDLFLKTNNGWEYVATTTWSKTCKDAIARYKAKHGDSIVKANFSK